MYCRREELGSNFYLNTATVTKLLRATNRNCEGLPQKIDSKTSRISPLSHNSKKRSNLHTILCSCCMIRTWSSERTWSATATSCPIEFIIHNIQRIGPCASSFLKCAITFKSKKHKNIFYICKVLHAL